MSSPNDADYYMYEIDNDEVADHIATLERRVKRLSTEVTDVPFTPGGRG